MKWIRRIKRNTGYRETEIVEGVWNKENEIDVRVKDIDESPIN
jgi:hypothetical protein